jgi:HEAT repeat protein
LSEESYYPDIDLLEENRDVEGLIKALEHSEYIVRKEAARSLKKVGDERAVEPLIRSLKYESWQEESPILNSVRRFSAEALGIIGDKRAIEALIQSIKEDADYEVRWRSAYALGQLGEGNYHVTEILIESLNSDSWTLRENAAKALGNLASTEVVEPLISLLDDKEWRVRKQAINSLGKIGSDEAVKPLLRLLYDGDTDVRRNTMEVLACMGDIAFDPLMDLYMCDDWQIRSKAAECLGKLGDERAVEYLVETLYSKKKEDRNRQMRGKIIEALGNIGDERAIDALVEVIDGDTLFLKRKAEDAILKIRSQSYPGRYAQFNTNSISFNYPDDWTVKTIKSNEKFQANNPDNTINLSIFRKSNLKGVTFEELIEIWEELFENQNIVLNGVYTPKIGNIKTFQMIGDNLKTNNIIIVAGYMLEDLYYYLYFTIKSDLTQEDKEDIYLIMNTFRVRADV